MLKKILPFTAMAAALWLNLSCSSQTPTADTQTTVSGDSAFTLVYQASREGGMDPCGCHTTPYGGLDREFNALQKLRGSAKRVIYADAGNLLVAPASKNKVAVLQAHAAALVPMMNEVALDIFAPGPADYRLGIDFLKKLAQEAKFKFVSTNVVDAKGATVFSAFEIVERDGVKVAFVSVTPAGTKLDKGYSVTDPKKALAKALAEIGDKASTVVVLSQVGNYAKEQKMAAAFPGAIWVGDDGKLVLDRGMPQGTNLMLDAHRYGYFLPTLTVAVKQPIKGYFSKQLIEENNKIYASLEKAAQNQVDAKRIATLKERAAAFKAAQILAPQEGGSEYHNEFIALDEKNYGAPNKVREMIAAEKERIRKAAIDKGAR